MLTKLLKTILISFLTIFNFNSIPDSVVNEKVDVVEETIEAQSDIVYEPAYFNKTFSLTSPSGYQVDFDRAWAIVWLPEIVLYNAENPSEVLFSSESNYVFIDFYTSDNGEKLYFSPYYYVEDIYYVWGQTVWFDNPWIEPDENYSCYDVLDLYYNNSDNCGSWIYCSCNFADIQFDINVEHPDNCINDEFESLGINQDADVFGYDLDNTEKFSWTITEKDLVFIIENVCKALDKDIIYSRKEFNNTSVVRGTIQDESYSYYINNNVIGVEFGELYFDDQRIDSINEIRFSFYEGLATGKLYFNIEYDIDYHSGIIQEIDCGDAIEYDINFYDELGVYIPCQEILSNMNCEDSGFSFSCSVDHRHAEIEFLSPTSYKYKYDCYLYFDDLFYWDNGKDNCYGSYWLSFYDVSEIIKLGYLYTGTDIELNQPNFYTDSSEFMKPSDYYKMTQEEKVDYLNNRQN